MDHSGKSPSESETIRTEVVCPDDSNPLGILLGGRLVEWMDVAAAVTAQLHSGKVCVTASIDKVKFIHSAKVGDIIIIKAKIHRAFNTSMEIGLDAYVKEISTGDMKAVCRAHFYFVAISTGGEKSIVPPVVPVSEDEREKFENALKNRQS